MSQRWVEVRTGSRLHFGMLSFGHADRRQFGGAGVMVDRPRFHIRLTPAEGFKVTGPLAERARRVALGVAERMGVDLEPSIRVEILRAPAEHTGLGVGTQLSLAVAAGMSSFYRGRVAPIRRLAEWSGRGQRSAIGCYGFRFGGLIAEGGKLPGEGLSPLVARIELPRSWRFVLLRPRGNEGLSGEAESSAFATLSPVPERVCDRLCGELVSELLPAASSGDFRRFARSLWRYGQLAGDCFRQVQGGTFAAPRLAQLAARVRKLGVEGVGQSSWGPTLFAVLDSPAAAERFIAAFCNSYGEDDVDLESVRPMRRGARIRQAQLASAE